MQNYCINIRILIPIFRCLLPIFLKKTANWNIDLQPFGTDNNYSLLSISQL